MIGLQDDEILHVLKPVLRNVRAPRQWNQTIAGVMLEIGILQHALDMVFPVVPLGAWAGAIRF
eukprot:1134032-Pyramimonas_sp.AAC.1